MLMLQRYNVDEQKMQNVPNQNNSQNIYFEAYCYSLELCDNPEIAQKVALRFLESMGMKEQSASVSDCGKPRYVAFPAVAILC
jgi:hypothetical protein